MADDQKQFFICAPILEKINEMEYYFCGEIEKLKILIINFFFFCWKFTFRFRKEIYGIEF